VYRKAGIERVSAKPSKYRLWSSSAIHSNPLPKTLIPVPFCLAATTSCARKQGGPYRYMPLSPNTLQPGSAASPFSPIFSVARSIASESANRSPEPAALGAVNS
jgi:hypothetical protein